MKETVLKLVQPPAGLQPERVLLEAAQADLSAVLVISWTADGTLYASSSTASIGENLRLAEVFKHELICGGFEL